jgi:hypothetical protein
MFHKGSCALKQVYAIFAPGGDTGFLVCFTDDGSSAILCLADPGSSVAVRDEDNAVEYLG